MLALQDISKQFNQTLVLDRVTLELKENRINCLLGPSGCGKSTLLRVAAGLLEADSGRVLLNPSSCAVVFQEPRLLPWLTVEENLTLALHTVPKREWQGAIADILKMMQLKGVEKYMSSELSGGMAQRVGIARAFLRKPQILLMDEPFAALDAITRSDLQRLLLGLIEEQKTTCLFVTHDINEAVTLGEQIFMMRHGRITQKFDSLQFRDAENQSALKKLILTQLNLKE